MTYKHNQDLIIFEQDDKCIIQMSDGTLHILNSTAYKVYLICDGRTEQEITDIMKSIYQDVEYHTLNNDVNEIIKSMLDKKIINV